MPENASLIKQQAILSAREALDGVLSWRLHQRPCAGLKPHVAGRPFELKISKVSCFDFTDIVLNFAALLPKLVASQRLFYGCDLLGLNSVCWSQAASLGLGCLLRFCLKKTNQDCICAESVGCRASSKPSHTPVL